MTTTPPEEAGGGPLDDPEKAARAQAVSRCVIGSLLTLTPTLGARSWIGSGESRRPGARLFARGLGARDVGIALGTLRALSRAEPARPWAQAALLADGVDFLATLAAARSLPRAALAFALAMSGASTALDAWLTTALD